MSTMFRMVVTCDAQRSPQCLGRLEWSADLPAGMWQAAADAARAGWLRGSRAERSYDVCPACRVDTPQGARTEGANAVEAPPDA